MGTCDLSAGEVETGESLSSLVSQPSRMGAHRVKRERPHHEK